MLKKSFLFATVLILAFLGLSSIYVFANETNYATEEQVTELLPSDPNYVGANANRPTIAPNDILSDSNYKEVESTGPSISPRVDALGKWYNNEPTKIKIYIRKNNDPKASGVTQTIDFSTYLRNVLPNEWISTWKPEALKMGAISVRSFGWYYVNHPKYSNLGAYVDNTTNCQVYKPNTSTPQTDAAFKATKGIAVHHVVNSTSIQDVGYYKAGTNGPGRDSSKYNEYNNVYQNGTQYWAKQGKDFKYMASYYYPGTSLVTGNGY
ncbi:SpoIID/LytB domain-containing protein [Gottfriedia sp. NPDC057991]|uniref:SpoIID/LytB domain-containing protein n=1 Tax=Gottfriedia sp. NPDC057991 TaxID=3346298 RepID=UPI0036DA3DEE